MLKNCTFTRRANMTAGEIETLLLRARKALNLPDGEIVPISRLADKAGELGSVLPSYVRQTVTARFSDEARARVWLPPKSTTKAKVSRF